MPKKRQKPPAIVDQGSVQSAVAPNLRMAVGEGFSRSPAEYFIRYSLSHDLHSQVPALAIAFEKNDLILPAQPEVYVRRLVTEIEEFMPAVYKPQDMGHTETQRFLYRLGVWNMWYPDDAVLEASHLFNNPKTRNQLRALLSSSQRMEDMIRVLQHTNNLPVTVKAINYFAYYYWNLQLLSVDEREMLYHDYRLAESVQTAGRVKGHSGRTAVLSKELPLTTPNNNRSWGDAFSNAYVHQGEACAVRNLKDKIYMHGEAVRTMYQSHRAMMEHQDQDAAASTSSFAVAIQVKQVARSTLTMGELAQPGFQPKRLPGRSQLKVIDGEKVEGKSAKNGGEKS